MPQCKLIIKDEVNCKLEGLDLDIRKKLVKKFKYELPYARHLPAVRLGRWDGTVAFFQLGGSTYINLLPEILIELEKYNWTVALEDRRAPRDAFEFEQLHEGTFSHINWPKGHVKAGQPILLRDYQIEIVNNFLSNPQSLQEVATGAGKTLMTAALSHSVQNYGRSIVIVPNKSLVTQTEADYINLGLDVGVYFGDRKDLSKQHTICTWQSINHLLKADKDSADTDDESFNIDQLMDNVVCVMVDECFDGDTNILTPTGLRKIHELKPGDKVINYAESTGSFKEDTVVKLHKNLTNSLVEPMLELVFDTGQIIKVTANHKFLTKENGWVRADQLTAEMEVIDINTSG